MRERRLRGAVATSDRPGPNSAFQIVPKPGRPLCERARDPEPISIRTSFQWATLSYRLRRFDEAVAEFDRIVAAAPHYYPAYMFSSAARVKVGEIPKATNTVNRALATVRPLPALVMTAGFVDATAGRAEQAQAGVASLTEAEAGSYISPSCPSII